MNNVVVTYFLWFLVVVTVFMYFYAAFKNPQRVSLEFGGQKTTSLKSLILVCMLDGIVIGLLIYYLLSTNS